MKSHAVSTLGRHGVESFVVVNVSGIALVDESRAGFNHILGLDFSKTEVGRVVGFHDFTVKTIFVAVLFKGTLKSGNKAADAWQYQKRGSEGQMTGASATGPEKRVLLYSTHRRGCEYATFACLSSK